MLVEATRDFTLVTPTPSSDTYVWLCILRSADRGFLMLKWQGILVPLVYRPNCMIRTLHLKWKNGELSFLHFGLLR